MRKPVESKFQLSPFSLRRAITGIKRPGIESIQQTGLRSDTGICHSGLPLRGNRNDRSRVGTCCCHAVWLKKCNRAELSGYPDIKRDNWNFSDYFIMTILWNTTVLPMARRT